jgi:hypothetical protein
VRKFRSSWATPSIPYGNARMSAIETVEGLLWVGKRRSRTSRVVPIT